jgi:hypothetical protein
MDLTFTEVEIDKGDDDASSDYLDDEGTYHDNSLYYNLEGVLTDDTGTSYYVEGESFPVDKGRRVNFECKDNKDDSILVKFCGFMTAYGIIGRYWKTGETSKNAGFFWIWSY